MVEIKRIGCGTGVRVELRNASLLLIKGEKGFIMCGYLDIEAAEKLGDCACVVSGVSTFDDVLEAEIKKATSKARGLGVRVGMSGREALDILS